jgi:hypothetical protein
MAMNDDYLMVAVKGKPDIGDLRLGLSSQLGRSKCVRRRENNLLGTANQFA